MGESRWDSRDGPGDTKTGAREKVKRAGGTPALRKAAGQFCGDFLLWVGVRACCVRHDWDVMVAQERMGAAVDKF
jgi:hypothetical protein